jgi:tol-pal system protein YbgF
VRITSLSQEIEALRMAIPRYPPPSVTTDPAASTDPALAGGAPAPVPPPDTGVPAEPSPDAGVPSPPVNPGISPQRLYDTAWTDYTAGQWALCIEGFGTYLRSFPRSEAADDAQFYIGECHFADGKYTEAMDAYTRVIANYPRGDKVPDAYYKRGIAFERLGQADRARESWETLIKLFPEAEVARLAKQNLDRLARSRPGA